MSEGVEGRGTRDEGAGMNWFAWIAQSRDPGKCVRDLRCFQLKQAEEDLAKTAAPNEFEVRVYALVVAEILRRWRSSLLSVGDR